MNLKKLSFLPLFLALSFMSCTKDAIDQSTDEKTNSQQSKLPIDGGGSPIYVDVVYAAGHVENHTSYPYSDVACLWIDGNFNIIGDLTKRSRANAVVVDNFDEAYVVGYESAMSTTTPRVAKLWYGGNSIDLTNGTADSYATSEFYEKNTNTVYIGGVDGTNGKIWDINGNTLYTFSNTTVTSIYVIGSDVYACGNSLNPVNGDYAKVWKNGNDITSTILGSFSSTSQIRRVESISVTGTSTSPTVIVTGNQGNASISQEKAAYWKNGVINFLTTSNYSASANSIAAFNSSSFIMTGYEYNGSQSFAKIWKVSSTGLTTSNVSNENAMGTCIVGNSLTDYYVSTFYQDPTCTNVLNMSKIFKGSQLIFTVPLTLQSKSNRIGSLYVKKTAL